MRTLSVLFLLTLTAASCAVLGNKDARTARHIRKEVIKSPVFTNSFTGFTLYDPAAGKTLVDVNGSHYFTPASNAKILTLATCLQVLGDSVPGLRYENVGIVDYHSDPAEKDSIHSSSFFTYCQATGDPTFLHPAFAAWQPVYQFLKHTHQPVTLDLKFFEDKRFGPGWSWEDYSENYSPERSAMPIFGNVMTLKKDSLHASPLRASRPEWVLYPFNRPDKWGWNLMNFNALKDQSGTRLPWRDECSNLVFIPAVEKLPEGYTQEIPLLNPDNLLHELLRDTIGESFTSPGIQVILGKPRSASSIPWPRHTVYSAPLDTVLRAMMYWSDNFIAEQMLLVCAGEKFGVLRQDTLIRWALDSVFHEIPQKPKWVDGSGLSRYDLISPNGLVYVLDKIWREQPHARILSLFPKGGLDGTLKGWYAGKNGKPYVWAKSGSMGGVQCLGGYVQTKSGNMLIFSFMHNNFAVNGKPWKVEMQRILEEVRDHY